jgi:hypothetical protein
MTNTKIKYTNSLNSDHSELRGSNISLNQGVNSGNSSSNTLTVNIKFKFAQTDKHGYKSAVLPINIPGNILFSMTDNYLYEHSHDMQLALTQKRHDNGFDKKYHKDKVQINGPTHYVESYYNQKFHHSEQALYTYLSERSNLDLIASQLKSRGLFDGTKVTKVTIDMHSIRYVCGNCEIGGFGLMNPKYGFKHNLSKALSSQNLKLGSNAKFYIAASAENPDATSSPLLKKDHIDIDLKNLDDSFVEADANIISIPTGNTDLHRRSVLISTKLKENYSYNTLGKKYADAVEAIKNKEYALMLSKGKALKLHYQLNRSIESNADDDPYSVRDIDNMSKAFEELAMLDDSFLESFIPSASKINNERSNIDKDIAEGYKAINNVKKVLLKNKIDQEEVSNLSMRALKSMKVFVDNNHVRELIKLIKNYEFIELVEKFTELDEINFLGFVAKAKDSKFSIEEDLGMKFKLYIAAQQNIARVEVLYDYLEPESVKDLYDLIYSEILHMDSEKLMAFAEESVIHYLKSSYEDAESLNFEELSDAYDTNEDMFWDIINDPEGIGAQDVMEGYALCNNSEADNDSDYFEADDLDDLYGLTPYDIAVAKNHDDSGYDLQDCDSMYEE